jgi:hypothetical protein
MARDMETRQVGFGGAEGEEGACGEEHDEEEDVEE